MKVVLALTLDKDAQTKSRLINNLFVDLNAFVKNKDYGSGILEYLVICQIVNPPVGFEHLHKDFKPKFIEHKSLTNRITGEPLVIEKQFSYSIKINGEKFDEFIESTDEESEKLLAIEFLNSLSYLDMLPKKIKDFDKEKFKSDMEQFFKEQKII